MKRHILYSFRRCPYAIRARWALKICRIKVEIREVDLKNKPKDVLKKSRNQTVPLLILENGEVINQSFDIILWALSNNKKAKLRNYFKDNNKNEIGKILKENDEIFKFHLDRFKYSSHYKKEEEIYHFKKCIHILNDWNNRLKDCKAKNYWLIGEEETIADWCLFPFVRQFKIACKQQHISKSFQKPINLWLHYFENHIIFEEIMQKYQLWQD